MSVQTIGLNQVGLSSNLFCNKNRIAAQITRDAVRVRTVGGNKEGCTAGLKVARQVIAEQGYTGEMSRATKSKVANMLAAWITAVQAESGGIWKNVQQVCKRFTFVTLTLPSRQQHSDNELKRIALGPFLQECKRKHNAAHQFWRAEPQKNGNLHFHILFNVEIPWRWIRTTWNSIMQRLDYIAAYRATQLCKHEGGFRYSREGLTVEQKSREVAAYHRGMTTNWQDPNSTDIHALQKVKNAAAYVCKYISKEGGSRKIEGRIWGCTDELRGLKQPEASVSEQFISLMQHLGKEGIIEQKLYERCAIYSGNILEILQTYAPELVEVIELYYRDIRELLNSSARC